MLITQVEMEIIDIAYSRNEIVHNLEADMGQCSEHNHNNYNSHIRVGIG